MYRSLMIAAGLMIGAGASAKTVNLNHFALHTAKVVAHVAPMISFNVGDTANYNLTMDGMSGTMVMKVTAVNGVQVTIDQNISIMGQTEDAVEVIDDTTGDIISITVNGQPQTPPAANSVSVISATPATITVPAGTFNTEDIKFNDNSTSPATPGEQWIDANDVPVGGMVQMTTTESEDGMSIPIEAQLTSMSLGSATVRH